MMVEHLHHFVRLGVVLSALACVAGAGAQRGAARTGSDDGTLAIAVDGRTRTFVVRAPRERPAPLPVVIVLHGGGGNAANAERMSGFTRLVDREGLIAVYPNGTGRGADRLLTWNATHCCGYAMTNRVDDVRFIDAMLDTLAARFQVDQGRIYVTGMSNGAMMAHRLGRELRHRPAAIAPVVGAVFGDESPPPTPVAVVIFNGLQDRAVPANGGLGRGVGRAAWDGTPPRPNRDQGDYWARANGCEAVPQVHDSAAMLLSIWQCPPGREVLLYQLKEAGHAWPGGRAGRRRADPPSQVIDATDVMWAFFKAHPAR